MTTTSPSTRYAVLGAGRQGTAAAYDLARFGSAACIVLADASLEAAERAAERVNRLAGRPVAEPQRLDVTDQAALKETLAGVDVALSAVPYTFNLGITRAAIEAGTSLCDMGGNTDVVLAQLALADQARAAGVSILPDCGMGPGMVNVLAVHAMDHLDQPRAVIVHDGGLPQNPQPPWNYELTFHINGLTNEYDGTVAQIRDGQIVLFEALSECQIEELDGLGTFETFIAAGGSTAPWTFEGRLEHFETRIIRYPGHFAQFKAFQTLGLFSEEPVTVGDQEVVPREVFHTLLAPHIVVPGIRDVCYLVATAKGIRDGREAEVVVSFVDRYDEETGFTAMERLTGWHCALMMGFQARGVVPPGASPLEQLCLDGTPSAAAIMAEWEKRGIPHTVRYRSDSRA